MRNPPWTTQHDGDNFGEPFREVDNASLHHYKTIGSLGEGGFAKVLKVEDKRHPGKVLACKVPKPNFKPYRRPEEILWNFRKEIFNMKSLSSHRHLVSLVDAYRLNFRGMEYELAIIFEPVANQGTLKDFIENNRGTRRALNRKLDGMFAPWFGCLANGLAFIHQSNVRHKDIAPSNILIHNGRVVFSDFGAAFHFAEGRSTTYGEPDPQQETFRAPEVRNKLKRNRSADIWSLGGVYCEILSVAIPDVAEVLNFPSKTTPFHNPDKHARVTRYLEKFFDAEKAHHGESIATWALAMLDVDPSERPRIPRRRSPTIYAVLIDSC